MNKVSPDHLSCLISRLFPVRRASGLALGALALAVVACGLLPGIRKSAASFDPVPGSRVLTKDYAYYRHPIWSPDGDLIAVLRSPSYLDAPGPASEGELVLINLVSGEQGVLDLGPDLKSGFARAPIFWMEAGEQLGFDYFELFTDQESPYLVVVTLASSEHFVIELCRCSPLALNREGRELLVNDSSTGVFHLSWFELETGEMREEVSLPRSDPREHGYIDFNLSPDQRTLLMGDFQGSVVRYLIGSGDAPNAFLSNAVTPAWSTDGSKLAYALIGSASDYYFGQLVVANADGSSPTPLFADRQQHGMLAPAWSPDGSQIAFLYQYGAANANSLLIASVPENLRPASAAP